jgi:hypothetical protein
MRSSITTLRALALGKRECHRQLVGVINIAGLLPTIWHSEEL